MAITVDFKLVNYGASTIPAKGLVNIRTEPTTSSAKIATIQGFIGVATTRVSTDPNGIWYEFYVNLPGHVYGWVRADLIKFDQLPLLSVEKAQNQLDLLISNNDKILSKLLTLSGQCTELRNKGVDVSGFEKQISTLWYRMKARDNKIKSNAKVTGVKTKSLSSYPAHSTELQNIVSRNKVGEIFTLTVILICVIVAAVTAGVTYYFFGADYSESGNDLKITDNIAAAMAKATPEERAAAIQDINKQIDAAYNDGASESTWGMVANALKYGVFFIGGVMLYKKFNDNYTKN